MDYILNNRINLAIDVLLWNITEGCPQIISEDVISSINTENINLIPIFLEDNNIENTCFEPKDHIDTQEYFKESFEVHQQGLSFGDASNLHMLVKFDFITRLMEHMSNIDATMVGMIACDVGSRLIWNRYDTEGKELHLALQDLRYDLACDFKKVYFMRYTVEYERISGLFKEVKDFAFGNIVSIIGKSSNFLRGSEHLTGFIDGEYSRYLVGGRVIKIKTYMFKKLFYWKANDTYYLIGKNGNTMLSVHYEGGDMQCFGYEKSFENGNYNKTNIEVCYSFMSVQTFKRKMLIEGLKG